MGCVEWHFTCANSTPEGTAMPLTMLVLTRAARRCPVPHPSIVSSCPPRSSAKPGKPRRQWPAIIRITSPKDTLTNWSASSIWCVTLKPSFPLSDCMQPISVCGFFGFTFENGRFKPNRSLCDYLDVYRRTFTDGCLSFDGGAHRASSSGGYEKVDRGEEAV